MTLKESTGNSLDRPAEEIAYRVLISFRPGNTPPPVLSSKPASSLLRSHFRARAQESAISFAARPVRTVRALIYIVINKLYGARCSSRSRVPPPRPRDTSTNRPVRRQLRETAE